jgi:ABC transporter DrrB family efflux protein
MTGVAAMLSDTFVLAQRNLIRIVRAPDLLTAFTVQPIMFVLLFVYVFGGAIQVPSEFDGYADFLIPGIVIQNIAFGGFATALGLADDLNRGLIDRFRSLPMARSAVLAGRTVADIATNTLSLVIVVGVGLIVGFGFSESLPSVLLGFLLVLLIGYAFSWVFAYIGLISSTPEAANAYGFMFIFPLTFISSAFVPPESMPAALEAFANANPFTTFVDALRALWQGTPAGNDVWVAFVWVVAITIAFALISTAKYRRTVVK